MNTHEIIRKQISEMNRHKWIESEKAGYDLGETALLEWAEKHVEKFVEKNTPKKLFSTQNA